MIQMSAVSYLGSIFLYRDAHVELLMLWHGEMVIISLAASELELL